jgi:hypothetical protein
MRLFVTSTSFFSHPHITSVIAKAENSREKERERERERETYRGGVGAWHYFYSLTALFDILFIQQKFQVPCDIYYYNSEGSFMIT